jgi:hypothetical protein
VLIIVIGVSAINKLYINIINIIIRIRISIERRNKVNIERRKIED